MVATTAGTASDTRKVLEILRAEFKLKELRTHEKITVPEAASFLSNMVYGNIRTPSMIPSITHFILSGYDEKGIYLFDISPDGYIQQYETCVNASTPNFRFRIQKKHEYGGRHGSCNKMY